MLQTVEYSFENVVEEVDRVPVGWTWGEKLPLWMYLEEAWIVEKNTVINKGR
jgi:hypothetical protein